MNDPATAAAGWWRWPQPDAAARAHSARLVERLRGAIAAAGGFLPFRRFMEALLYEPGLGYYSAGSRKFGPDGDFTTAPELSPLFADCVARHCADVLHSIGGGVLFEVGAGSGALCCGVLRALESLGVLPERYLVLETSAELRARQQHRVQQEIPALAARVSWIDTPPDQDWRGLLLANEVLDALPVERVILDQDSIRQQGVGVEQGAFCWRDRVAPPPLRDAAQELQAALPQPLPSPYRTEINLQLAPWLDAIAGRLAAGCVLLIDYGGTRGEVYHPERRDGTLICHYRHRAHGDPFLYPGLQDVSAAVDFTAVAGWAATAGMQLYGYTTLAHFLIDSGLDEALRKRARPDGVPDARSAGQARLLTLPGEMGERFKTMALGRGLPQTPRGFAGSDQRARLFTTR